MQITKQFAADSDTWYQPKDIERKLRAGEHVTNDELSQAIKFYKHLGEMLGCLDARWYFATDEANRLFRLCRQYRDARTS